MPSKLYTGIWILLPLVMLNACKHGGPKEGIRAYADTTCCHSLKIDRSDSGFSTQMIIRHAFVDTIYVDGVITADPNHRASVSAPMKGFLKSIRIQPGEKVSRGQLLAILEHPDYGQLQLDYLETKSRYEYLKLDYARQGELGLEHATSLKNVQKAQSDFISMETRIHSLKNQLQYIGINPDSVHLNNIVSTIRIVSPITGITAANQLSVGQICTEESPLFIITDYSKLLVAFEVPQEYLKSDLINTYITFYPVPNSGKYVTARISAFYPVETEAGLFTMQAEINDNDYDLTPGMKVRSFLSITDTALAIPNEAILDFINGSYVYYKRSEDCFILQRIVTGRIQRSMTEILNSEAILNTNEIAVSGLKNITGCMHAE